MTYSSALFSAMTLTIDSVTSFHPTYLFCVCRCAAFRDRRRRREAFSPERNRLAVARQHETQAELPSDAQIPRVTSSTAIAKFCGVFIADEWN